MDGSRDIVVGIVTATRWTVRSSNSETAFFSSPTRTDELWGPPSLFSRWVGFYRGRGW